MDEKKRVSKTGHAFCCIIFFPKNTDGLLHFFEKILYKSPGLWYTYHAKQKLDTEISYAVRSC